MSASRCGERRACRNGAAVRRRRTFALGHWTLALTLLGQPLEFVRRDGPARTGSASSHVSTAHQPADSGGARFVSVADSIDWEWARSLAARARGFRLVISLSDRRLWVLLNTDTLRTAPIAVASGATLAYQGKRWSFRMPRGRRVILGKDSLPVWIPPDWHYYEVARERGLVVRLLLATQPVPLMDGTSLVIRSGFVGLLGPDSSFVPLPPNDEIIADGMLFIPPVGTMNRRIYGELGSYRIDLGNGYLLHGTPHGESIGRPATHGCVRLRDDDIAWLYEFVYKGVPVYIY